MKTRCPDCGVRFNAPDRYKGKKALCPKCRKPFIVTVYHEAPKVELCTNCDREISRSEPACVFEGEIVCAECDKNLRGSKPQEPNIILPPEYARYKGVRGWLLFFCISLTILSPLGNSILWVKAFNEVSQHLSKFPGLRATFGIDGLLTILIIAFSIYAGISLWTVRPNAVKIAKSYLLAYVVIVTIESFFLPFMAGLPTELNGEIIKEGFKGAGRAYLFFSIWNSYLNKSKRVKATYEDFPV